MIRNVVMAKFALMVDAITQNDRTFQGVNKQ